MTLEQIEEHVKDGTIYSFSTQQLKECLKVIAELDVGGNPNFHARLIKNSNFINFVLSDLSAQEQLQQTTKTANIAIAISIVSIAASVILTVANYCFTDKSSKETTDQLRTELRKIHKEEQRIFSCLSSNASKETNRVRLAKLQTCAK